MRSCAWQTLATTRQKQLYKRQKENLEISLKLVKIQLRLGFDQRSKDYESHALTTQPQTLNKPQTLATKQ